MLHHVCDFAIGVMLNLLNIFTVGMNGCVGGEVNHHLHRLG